jgi:lipopolysaccharide biosynthesis regulator YciM
MRLKLLKLDTRRGVMKEMMSRDTGMMHTRRMTSCSNPKCGGLCFQNKSLDWECPSCGKILKRTLIIDPYYEKIYDAA